MSAAEVQVPAYRNLSHAQRTGWACVWCGASLAKARDAVLVGKSRGRQGAHVLDSDVYACSKHPRGSAT